MWFTIVSLVGRTTSGSANSFPPLRSSTDGVDNPQQSATGYDSAGWDSETRKGRTGTTDACAPEEDARQWVC